jgi:y4mF family transcriptional regulator
VFPCVIRSAKDAGLIARRTRKKQALTQADLSGLSSTGNRFIVDLENGKGTVQFDKVMHILNMLGLEVTIRPKGYRV